jgi:hypothetical protein
MASENGADRADAAYLQTEETVIGQVREAIEQIEYGSILIKIHQGEVVGIETSTKLRLNRPKG